MLFQSVDSLIPAVWLSRGRPDPDFSIPNMGEESREHKKKREETEAYRKPNTRRDVVESQSRSVRRTALTYSLAPMLTNEQLGRQD